LGELQPGKLIEESALSKDAKAQMLGLSALEWLGLDSDHFVGK
jgi:hypothetical protein